MKDAPADSAMCTASPSLALTKYWGKEEQGTNVPATSSLAVALKSLTTTTRVQHALGADTVVVDGEPQAESRYAPVFEAVRAETGSASRFLVESTNDFPTAAGLASSSSGIAALVCALDALLGAELPSWKLSRIARLGSGSAARAVFGGFTVLPAGGTEASSIHPAEYWPELRMLVIVLQTGSKAVSSREAMERVRRTSPYFSAWRQDAEEVFSEAREAVSVKDIDRLGHAMRLSYLRMFSTMFAADPPVVYWQPQSLSVIRVCEELRREGIPTYETMDAGPQVKVLTTVDHLDTAYAALSAVAENILVSSIGAGPQAWREQSEPASRMRPADDGHEVVSQSGTPNTEDNP
ncbi:MAG: diphosphomevalonate decarboxylase [Spirochaetota bacterium]